MLTEALAHQNVLVSQHEVFAKGARLNKLSLNEGPNLM